MSPLLRPATLADLPDLLDMQEAGSVLALGHIFPQDKHPFPRSVVHDRWVAEIADPDIEVLVAGTVEAFAAIRGNELLHFGTAVATWGSGLAAAVHAELVGRFAGTPTARLRVFEENRRARRFYEKMGWTSTERRTRTAFPPHPVLVEYELTLKT